MNLVLLKHLRFEPFFSPKPPSKLSSAIPYSPSGPALANQFDRFYISDNNSLFEQPSQLPPAVWDSLGFGARGSDFEYSSS